MYSQSFLTVQPIPEAIIAAIITSFKFFPYLAILAQYPYNHVFESESGHIIEIDDTPNNERLHTMHRTMTYEEIGPDGSKAVKVVMDNYTVILRDNLCHIQGVCNVTIDGNCNLYVGNDLNVEVNNDANVVVKEI